MISHAGKLNRAMTSCLSKILVASACLLLMVSGQSSRQRIGQSLTRGVQRFGQTGTTNTAVDKKKKKKNKDEKKKKDKDKRGSKWMFDQDSFRNYNIIISAANKVCRLERPALQIISDPS